MSTTIEREVMVVRQIRLSDIKIDRERYREATGDMEGLAASLLKHGQLQPIVIEESMELVAGFRRYTAAGMNGWTTIAAVMRNDLTELKAREIELEENLQREQMTWQERARGIADLDRIRRAQDPTWTQGQTAVIAGGKIQQRDVSQAIKLENAMKLFPEIAKAKSTNQALSWLESKAKNVLRTHEVSKNHIDFSAISEKILLGDSREVIMGVPDESFHLVLTDPPFGINYDERKAGTDGSLTAYEDSEEYYETLLGMAPELYRVVKQDGWLVWFLGMSWYEKAKLAFRNAGFTVDELPIIWNRSNGRCHTNRPDRYFARGYDIALHCFKGEPQMVQRGKPNVLTIDPVANEDRQALVERPIELYQELIRRLTVEGECVADFFVGAGGVPAAAASLRRDYFGCELSPDRRAIALNKIKANTP